MAMGLQRRHRLRRSDAPPRHRLLIRRAAVVPIAVAQRDAHPRAASGRPPIESFAAETLRIFKPFIVAAVREAAWL